MTHTKTPLFQRVLGSTAIIGALYMILFSGIPNLSNDDAERMLSELASHFSTEASYRGGEAKLQYSNVEVHGFAYDKWARTSNLAFDFMYPQWQGHNRLGLSTQNADLIPDHTTPQRMTLRFTDAINLISGSELLAIMHPVKPILYAINQKPAATDGAISHRLIIPANIDISMLQPKRELKIELPEPIRLDVNFFKTQHRLHAHLVSGIAAILSPSGRWSMENADIRYDTLQKSPDTVESKGTLTLDRLAFARDGISTSPFAATAAWGLKEQRNISGSVDTMSLEIDHGLLTNGDVKVSATGNVNFDIDDAPYGEIVVEISNPADFAKSGWIAKDKQEEALALLDEILGEKIGSHKQAIINIARAKNGEWKIGKLPLNEELTKKILNILIFNTQEPNDQNTPEKTSETSSQSNPS